MFLEYLYAEFPALVKEFFRQLSIGYHDIYIGKPAEAEAAFHINLRRIHQRDHLTGLPDRGLLQQCFIADPAGESYGRMKSGDPEKSLIKITRSSSLIAE